MKALFHCMQETILKIIARSKTIERINVINVAQRCLEQVNAGFPVPLSTKSKTQ